MPLGGDGDVRSIEQLGNQRDVPERGEWPKRRDPRSDLQARPTAGPPAVALDDMHALLERGKGRRIGTVPLGALERDQAQAAPAVQQTKQSRAVRAEAAVGVEIHRERAGTAITPNLAIRTGYHSVISMADNRLVSSNQ